MMTKRTELLSILFKSFATDKKHANNNNMEDYLFNAAKDMFTSKVGHLMPVLPDVLMAIASLPERAMWIKGHLDHHPESEALLHIKATIILMLKETKRLIKRFGELPSAEYSCFRYWNAVQEAHDVKALLEEDEDGKE
jgi:hypothetical protein